MIPGRSGTVVDILAGLPDPIVVLFGLVTQLADLWFFFTVLALAYLLSEQTRIIDRRGAVFLVAVAFGSIAVVQGLKLAFALPRPPAAATVPEARALPTGLRPLYAELATSAGYGFPSGHATAATALYGAAAVVVDYRSREWRAVATGILIVVIALSRVVLGVHYLVDVLAGILIGGAILAGFTAVGERGTAPSRALSLTLIVALIPAMLAFTTDTLAILGGAFGARLTWSVVGEAVLSLPTDRTATVAATVVAGPIAGGLFAVAYTLELPVAATFVANALVPAVVLAAPVAAQRTLA